jgi:hypothetical protein
MIEDYFANESTDNIASVLSQKFGDYINYLRSSGYMDLIKRSHKQYFKGRNPWEYDNEQLDVLCDICHKNTHHVIDAIKMMISYSDTSEIYNILSGYLDEKIRIKSYEFENVMSFYEQSKQNIGLIAGLLNYVHPKYQSNIADFIISLSFNEEEATDFFRKKFESAEDYDE